MNITKRCNIISALLSLLMICPVLICGQELLPTPKPTHTEEGVPCSTLKTVKIIELDFDQDLFFAVPWKMTVSKKDKQGRFYFYVYDYKLVKMFVFLFNKKFEYVGQFLDHGEGPGEVLPGLPGNKAFYPAPDGSLYVCESVGNKLIQFSATGKFIKDIKIPLKMRTNTAFPPVFDNKGFLYKYSTNNGLIDKLDDKMSSVHTFLDRKLNNRYIIFKPKQILHPAANSDFHLNPDETNVMYDLTSDGHLLIYLYNSSTAYVFKNDKLVRKFDILIDRVLPIHKKRSEESLKKQAKLGPRSILANLMFSHAFVDKDTPSFYLRFRDENGLSTLYQIDLMGNLIGIINNVKPGIRAKRNGLFFGLTKVDGERYPIILKKENNK